MARKIYKTTHGVTSYSTGLVIPGRKSKVYISFTGGVTNPTFIPSTHVEDDEVIQKALEKSASFGKKFVLAHTFKEAKKATPASVPADVGTPSEAGLKNIHQVKSINQAVTNLIKNGYSGDVDSLTDVESIQAAAKTIGLIYTKLA